MLVKCRVCGIDVSTEANNCSHCGYPQKQDHGLPKCPTCGSIELDEISVGDIAKSKFLWVPLKNLAYKCRKCGHKC